MVKYLFDWFRLGQDPAIIVLCDAQPALSEMKGSRFCSLLGKVSDIHKLHLGQVVLS
jgi:hypothetical protein